MLILSRKMNESIMIGDKIEISIVDLKGDQVKLGIKAPRDVKVYRQEVYEAIQQENREAAKASSSLPSLGPLVGNDSAKTSSSAASDDKPEPDRSTTSENGNKSNDS